MEPHPITDRTTTPRVLRPVALLFLLVVMFYFATANFWALEHVHEPDWVSRNPAYSWFGGWKMFTELDTGAQKLDAEVEVDGDWVPIELTSVFPTVWDSGPRYARTWFRQSNYAMGVLAHATCGRLADQHPTRVRFTTTSWTKRLGRKPEPPPNATTKLILDWDCSKPVARPKGRPI